jgi:hypothetical protein
MLSRSICVHLRNLRTPSSDQELHGIAMLVRIAAARANLKHAKRWIA